MRLMVMMMAVVSSRKWALAQAAAVEGADAADLLGQNHRRLLGVGVVAADHDVGIDGRFEVGERRRRDRLEGGYHPRLGQQRLRLLGRGALLDGDDADATPFEDEGHRGVDDDLAGDVIAERLPASPVALDRAPSR